MTTKHTSPPSSSPPTKEILTEGQTLMYENALTEYVRTREAWKRFHACPDGDEYEKLRFRLVDEAQVIEARAHFLLRRYLVSFGDILLSQRASEEFWRELREERAR